MNKGQKVECVSLNPACRASRLTEGSVYVVTAGVGDVDSFGCLISDADVFEIADDAGNPVFNYTMISAHATWELVSK